MAEQFPSDLPLPLERGHTIKDSVHVRQNDVEIGPPRFELLSIEGPVSVKANWIFTQAEMNTFELFFKDTLVFGSKSFTMDIATGGGLTQHEFHMPSFTQTANRKTWSVKADLIAIQRIFQVLPPAPENIIFHMPLKTDLSITVGIGPAVFTRGGIATDVDESTGVLMTFAGDVPRFQSKGILIEGFSENDVLNNRDLTASDWVKTGVTVARDAIGLDNVANAASTITATSTNGTVLQSTSAFFVPNNFSVDVRRKTGFGIVEITNDGFVTFTDITNSINTSTYTRVNLPGTASNPNVGLRIATIGDEVEVDYAAAEERSAIATSRIETGASVGIRNFDSLIVDEANIPAVGEDYSISFLGNTLGARDSPLSQGFYFVDGENIRKADIMPSGTSVVANNGTGSVTHVNLTPQLTPVRYTITLDNSAPTDGFKLYIDNIVESGLVQIPTGTKTKLFIGASGFAFGDVVDKLLFGNMSDFKIWDIALTAEQVASLVSSDT